MNGHHDKYFSVDIVFFNHFIAMQREFMISSVAKNSWNWNFADFRDFILLLSEAATVDVLWKMIFLKISQYSQESTCLRVSF